jgi:hypothetical protein
MKKVLLILTGIFLTACSNSLDQENSDLRQEIEKLEKEAMELKLSQVTQAMEVQAEVYKLALERQVEKNKISSAEDSSSTENSFSKEGIIESISCIKDAFVEDVFSELVEYIDPESRIGESLEKSPLLSGVNWSESGSRSVSMTASVKSEEVLNRETIYGILQATTESTTDSIAEMLPTIPGGSMVRELIDDITSSTTIELEAIPKPKIETMLLIGKYNVHDATYRFSS